MAGSRSPAASGVRLGWKEIPERLRTAAETWLGGEVTAAWSQPGGFSPGVAARLQISDGRRMFAKAAGPKPNPLTPVVHRREARVVAALPAEAPVPRLLWSHGEGDEGWVVLLFEDAGGWNPSLPWQRQELARALEVLLALPELLTPSPLPVSAVGSASAWSVISGQHWRRLREERPARLDAWSTRHLDKLAAVEAEAPSAVAGDTLLHLDLRADNLLLTPERALVVDWPHARVGAPWVDLIFFAPSVAMQGGPLPEALLARHPRARRAGKDAVTAALAAISGFFTREGLQPAPPGLPTLRAFQTAQGEAARSWLARRTGWA